MTIAGAVAMPPDVSYVVGTSPAATSLASVVLDLPPSTFSLLDPSFSSLLPLLPATPWDSATRPRLTVIMHQHRTATRQRLVDKLATLREDRDDILPLPSAPAFQPSFLPYSRPNPQRPWSSI